MDFIQIPNTNCKIYDGSIVMIARFPQTKWIVHNGFYSYSGEQQSGWYFQSIPAGTIIPMNSADLTTLTIISNPSSDPHVCPPPGPAPGPTPCPDYPRPHPHHHAEKSVEKYRPGMYYRAGQTLYGAIGEYYQVVEDYRSSYSEQSTAQNIENDVTNGYLIALPTAGDLDTINKHIEDLGNSKVATSTTVNGHALTDDVTIRPDDLNYANPKLGEVENVKEALDALVEKEPDLSTKMDKQPTAVSGHIATFGNTGQVVDSGKTVDDIRPVWDDGE